ncbi:hypothetical protein MNBD_GAMMA17-1196 [hydrothermal vent metagenome]|uniref:ABC transporter permease n=1 Tax=hydrothermal vent metagenome TaxID=652676 RepID=A0A3B0ZIB9_9ZZZZ
MNGLLIAIRNILRDGTRVLSTLLIIATGLTALLLGSGFMLSTYDSLQEIGIRSEGHLIIIDDNPTPLHGGSHQQLTLDNWQTIQTSLWNDERVLRVLPRAHFEGLIVNGNNSAVFFGRGVDPQEEFRVHGPFLRTTGVLDPWIDASENQDVVLGVQLARTLNAATGDLLTLKIVGSNGKINQTTVYLAGTYQNGTPEIDDHTLMVSLTTAAQLLGTNNISQLSIYLNQSKNAPALQASLQKSLNNVNVQTWQQRAELYHKVKSLYDRIFGVMGLIILVVVFLAITNTVSLATYQRREEIATLSALGTRPIRIYANFILEALLIGITATILGMLLAYTASQAINLSELMMPAPPGKTEGYPIFIYISLPHYLLTSLVLIAVVVGASLLATYNTIKINIATTLA